MDQINNTPHPYWRSVATESLHYGIVQYKATSVLLSLTHFEIFQISTQGLRN